MSRFEERVRSLAAEAHEERESFDPPESPPAPDRALDYLQEGLAPVLSLYIESRTGDYVAFSEAEWVLLERALNDWLECYARCYGVAIDAEFSVREAAELLVETHDLRDTAQLLTRVPERGEATKS
ncbi:hypothetical protein [Salinirarus marinus]|uniref:hypothetical protein n=1 Tax=Salinirarus marinus TaxID=3068310 RepID=UPI003C6BF942